jgi:hypothetical protein
LQPVVSQLPVSRQLIFVLFAAYPLSQTTAAVDPNVVVVKFKAPFVTFSGDPQSVENYHIHPNQLRKDVKAKTIPTENGLNNCHCQMK